MQDGSLSWTSSTGHSSAGALVATATLSSGDVSYVMSPGTNLGDLSDRLITMYVELQSGTNVTAKLFIRDTSYEWADAGAVALSAGGWICLSLNVSDPAYTDGVFDPTQVRDFGIEIHGEGAVELYLDDIGY
jgi:hypothetical protein